MAMNMERYRKYTTQLDFDAASHAMLTGIAIGWVQTRPYIYTGEQDMIAACIECDFCVRVRWRSGKPEAQAEELLLSRMRDECKGRMCKHWLKFCEYFYEAGLHWHNFIVAETSDADYPRFKMSTLDERQALRPRSGFGRAAAATADVLSLSMVGAKR